MEPMGPSSQLDHQLESIKVASLSHSNHPQITLPPLPNKTLRAHLSSSTTGLADMAEQAMLEACPNPRTITNSLIKLITVVGTLAQATE